MSCSDEVPFSYPTNPQEVRSKQSVDSFLQATCVHLSTTWPHLVVLPRVPSCPDFGTSRLLMSRRGPLNLRTSKCAMCDEALIQWSSLDLDPMTILAPHNFATLRLGAPNLWALTLRTSEFTISLDLCHLSSSDGRS
jgi:hypothetical protein